MLNPAEQGRTPQPEQKPEPSWLEQFKALHPLEKIQDETVRRQFGKFLDNRAANRAWYLAIMSNGRWDEGIGNGDSAQKQLRHQIEHSTLRIMGLATGEIKDYRYEAIHPNGHKEILGMNSMELIEQLDKVTIATYGMLTVAPECIEGEIALPWGRKTTGAGIIEDMMLHEALQVGSITEIANLSKTPRPQEMINAWG